LNACNNPRGDSLRHRLLSYFTAACINLAIVGGMHEAPMARRPPIVHVRQRVSTPGRFAAGELLRRRQVAVRTHRAARATFSLN